MRKIECIAGVLFFFCCCGSDAPPKPIASAPPLIAESGRCATPRKITAIYKSWVYDLSGYEGVGGNSAFNLFDENAYVDPKNQQGYNPKTSPHPYQNTANYFPRNIGSRIVLDLQVPYRLAEIYLYDAGRSSDSVWVYTGNMQDWKMRAAFTTSGEGWRKFVVDDSTQYVMFRFSGWEAKVTEAVLYGCPFVAPPPEPPAHYTGPRLAPKTMREFLGVNTYQGVSLQWMKPFYNTRLYTMVDQLDADTVHAYPNNLFNLTVHGWWNGAIQDYVMVSDSIVRFNNGRVWYSILGVPRWLEQKGYSHFDRPLTELGMNPEDPLSYARHANLYWNLAAVYGGTKVDTSLIRGIFGQGGHPKFSGRKLMNVFENGNEVDAYWVGNKYWSPVEYFAISSADYDGHERKMGPRQGIRQADSNSNLMMSGFCNLDTNRARVLKFLCNTMRSDHRFLWQAGIQYHHYSTNGGGTLPGETFGHGTAGLSPEEDSLRTRLARVREYTYRVQPDVECILGEYGYDKSRKSKVSAPLVPGYDAKQSQGIMLLRGINAVAFSGFDRLVIYWIKDDHGEDEASLFLSSGLIKQVATSQQEPYPSWFYISTLVNWLGNYVPDKVVSESGPVWVYKYRHQVSRDSVAYFVYCPTHNGSRADNYNLKVGKTSGKMALSIAMADNSTEGEATAVPISNGIIRIGVTEVPKILLMREK